MESHMKKEHLDHFKEEYIPLVKKYSFVDQFERKRLYFSDEQTVRKDYKNTYVSKFVDAYNVRKRLEFLYGVNCIALNSRNENGIQKQGLYNRKWKFSCKDRQ